MLIQYCFVPKLDHWSMPIENPGPRFKDEVIMCGDVSEGKEQCRRSTVPWKLVIVKPRPPLKSICSSAECSTRPQLRPKAVHPSPFRLSWNRRPELKPFIEWEADCLAGFAGPVPNSFATV